MRETQVRFLGREDPLEKEMATHSNTGKSHGWMSLVGYSSWGRKESETTERLHFHFHALEKKMATHSSTVAWRVPGTGAWWAAVYGVTQSRTRLK